MTQPRTLARNVALAVRAVVRNPEWYTVTQDGDQVHVTCRPENIATGQDPMSTAHMLLGSLAIKLDRPIKAHTRYWGQVVATSRDEPWCTLFVVRRGGQELVLPEPYDELDEDDTEEDFDGTED
jgi:hypothetical protein